MFTFFLPVSYFREFFVRLWKIVEYAVFSNNNRKVVKIQSINGMESCAPSLKYVVWHDEILFYSDIDIIPKHFIYKFNEKLNFNDVDMICQMY